MYLIYVLLSLKTGKKYIGFTGRDLKTRLREHNLGFSKWTKGHRPLKLVYFETFYKKKDALKREKFLKSGQGRKFLDHKIVNNPR